MTANRAYDSVKELVKKHGGEMEWKPGGTGGTWVLKLCCRRSSRATSCALSTSRSSAVT